MLILHPRQLLILVCVSIEFITSGSIQTATFRKVIGPNPGLAALEAGWLERSQVACAAACLHRRGLCRAFTHNETSGLCVVGHSAASVSPYSLQAPNGTLYASTECDVNLGFGIYSRPNVTTCLWISTGTANLATAQQSCQDKGGNVVTLQTQEKLDIFKDIAIAMIVEIWIGADDRAVEDEFRWHNDNSVMTNAQRATIFASGQPSNSGNEDCVHSQSGGNRLMNDISCSRSFSYICEREPVTN